MRCSQGNKPMTEDQTYELKYGDWKSYGGDGRLTIGIGWRARFTNKSEYGDYYWGPLSENPTKAIEALNQEYEEATKEI